MVALQSLAIWANVRIMKTSLEFDFPLCMDRNKLVFNTDMISHSFQMILAFIVKKYQHNATVGPCRQVQFAVHYSPSLSMPKVGHTRRAIVNLSAPCGCAVNYCILDDIYDNICAHVTVK